MSRKVYKPGDLLTIDYGAEIRFVVVKNVDAESYSKAFYDVCENHGKVHFDYQITEEYIIACYSDDYEYRYTVPAMRKCDTCGITKYGKFTDATGLRCRQCIKERKKISPVVPAAYVEGNRLIIYFSDGNMGTATVIEVLHMEHSGLNDNRYVLQYKRGKTCGVVVRFEDSLMNWYPYDLDAVLDEARLL